MLPAAVRSATLCSRRRKLSNLVPVLSSYGSEANCLACERLEELDILLREAREQHVAAGV